MYHGIINVYKEAGFTSHDVVAKLRGICKQKKIGHTGTLDPDAVGVLPVCLGNGTRLCHMLTDRSKEYIACLRLGITTDTQDISGKVLEEKEARVSPEEVRRTAASFVGEILQTPPMYSALKVNGKKLCDLARKGLEVERTARPVTVFSIEMLKEEHPEYTIKVACSKGTYIRTLCHDIGQALGCGGVMKSLARTRVGEFAIDNALTLGELQRLSDENSLIEAVVPVEQMFWEFSVLTVKESAFGLLKNGNPLRKEDVLSYGKTDRAEGFDGRQQFRVHSHKDIFYGIYSYEEERGLFIPVKMFLPESSMADGAQ